MFIVEYFTSASGRSPVKEFIFDQNIKTRNKILETITFLEKFGFQLPTNYLRKIISSQKLWELRIKYQSKQFRIFLAKREEKIILLLHAIIKKRQKTPQKDIEVAENRLKEVQYD